MYSLFIPFKKKTQNLYTSNKIKILENIQNKCAYENNLDNNQRVKDSS